MGQVHAGGQRRARGCDAGSGPRHLGSYSFDAQNSRKSKAATRLDAALGHGLSETAALELHVRNLLDGQHVVGSGTADDDTPGRALALPLRKTW
ncbi:hypothetical protein [Rhodobacter capsulatus]|uniref:hypothetical protein n=1 Tax=Rhodobacter capsulatus TaxID=1061 RepID=UPI0020167AD7|nr:hypothetical protein [Rhodobacter capsulatus]